MFDFKYLKNDIFAGVVVFLVSLPLCLGIALASDAPLFAGIIAGIIGGMIVTPISRCTLGVSGPAAGLAVIVAQAIGQLGFDAFLLATMVAGIIQITAGFLRLGIISHYIPSAVIKGILAGIGVIMVLKQIPHAVGYDTSWMGEMAFIEADGHNTLSELYYMFLNLNPGAIIISVLGLSVLLMWERPIIKQNQYFKLIPAPLLVVILGIVFNEMYRGFFPHFYIDTSHLVNLPIAASFSEFTSFFTLPDFSQWNNGQIYEVAITLAVIASIETLLVVEATDKLDPEKRVTPTNLELKAQGIGNFVTGLIGGLPITQVIVRSAANIEAGGKTRLASLFHGLLLVVTAFLIPGLLNKIPFCSLAAILLVVGYKLTRISLYRQMFKQGRWQFIPFIVTVLALVFTDMLTGVFLGLAVGVFHILLYNYKVDYFLEENKDNHFTLRLSEHMSFLNKAGIMKALRGIPGDSHIVIDGTKTEVIDHDVREVIENFTRRAIAEKISFELKGLDNIRIQEENDSNEDKISFDH